METFKNNDIQFDIYTDLKEWLIEFYGMPENAHPDSEGIDNCAGFASIAHSKISILVSPESDFAELLQVVSHELGHIVEGGFTKNPPQEPAFDNTPGAKAEHYENFAMTAYWVTRRIKMMLRLNGEPTKPTNP